jgi:hypothetical protein
MEIVCVCHFGGMYHLAPEQYHLANVPFGSCFSVLVFLVIFGASLGYKSNEVFI